MEKQKTISLTIDQTLLDLYNKFYFEKYPRRKKVPIARPIHESLNVWTIKGSMQKNNLKQNWKEFIVWWINIQDFDYQIEECSMVFTTYYPTRRRVDVDNTVPKFILDGFVESGFLVDDDSKHLQSLTLKCDYDKDNPRTEISVFIYKETKK